MHLNWQGHYLKKLEILCLFIKIIMISYNNKILLIKLLINFHKIIKVTKTK